MNDESIWVRADLHSGTLTPGEDTDDENTKTFAAVVGELFRPVPLSWAAALAGIGEGASDCPTLDSLVIVSGKRVHVAQRLEENEDLALLGVTDKSRCLGLIFSELRQRSAPGAGTTPR